MYNESACWNSRPKIGKSGPSRMGVVIINKENGSQSIGAELYHPQFNKPK
jgi:hypothetical protein